MKKQKIFGIRQKVAHPEKVRQFYVELCADIPEDKRSLEQRKYAFAKREQIDTILNRDILAVIPSESSIPPKLERLLTKRSVRTISGVSPIGILTKPYPCPGKCVYCPTEDRMPKSYMSNQPAAARALRNKFHPYRQVHNRMMALSESGHSISKLEVIVMGGTWSFLPHKYQHWYIRKCFEAANQFSIIHDQLSEKESVSKVGNQGTQSPDLKKQTLKNLQHDNETAQNRIIGLTLETRPDFIIESELKRMREYGCTRIEIGVQTLDDEVQRLTRRGHGRKHVIRAMKLMKEYGFKVCFHLMPGLPGSSLSKDLEWMKEVFENPDFRPDFIKIYPCVVVETAELKQWWEDGRYKPLEDQDLIKLLVQYQTFIPEWTRVMRLMRDIPVSNILGGAKFSNLRQILNDQPKKLREIVGEDFYAEHKLAEKGYQSRDIRAREIGFADLEKHPEILTEKPVLVRRDYQASDGLESFLSFETPDKKHVFALLRLRKPDVSFEPQFFRSVLKNAALIREVHSYGTEISVGESAGMGQHRGLGRKLIEEAERIARDEWGLGRMTIIAGVGTREYYRKWGYELKSTYMTKKLIK
jgi:elongator complex protein 3